MYSYIVSYDPFTYWCSEHAKQWNPPEGVWFPYWMKYQVFAPLLALQMVNLLWYFLIWRILMRYVYRSIVDKKVFLYNDNLGQYSSRNWTMSVPMMRETMSTMLHLPYQMARRRATTLPRVCADPPVTMTRMTDPGRQLNDWILFYFSHTTV